jgi:ABC-type multidrug transport system ATPase subunit
MDEADVLGDRIGIMRSGRLVTVGSSLFLKKRFGIGYHLTVEQESETIVSKFLKENLGEDIKFVSQVANEVTYQVPTDYNSKFKEFFALFDSKLEELSVHSYGITVTTLEEVFLKAGEGNHHPEEVAKDNLIND